MNKRKVFIVILVTTVLLYDLVFYTTCFFPEQCYFLVHLVAPVLYSHVIMVAIAKAFPNIARLPYCLYIPSNSFQIEIKMEKCYRVRQELNRQIDSNLCVPQWALLLVLCLCLQHLKIRQCHLTFLSSFFYSTFTSVFGMLTILIFMKWEKIYNTCSKKIVKYNHTLKYLLKMIFFPFVVIIRLVLHFLELLYKSCLQIKSRSIFSLVHYFWSLASRIFLVLVMVTYLLLYYRVSILLNLSPTQTLAVGHSVPFLLSSHCPHSDSICSTLWISCSFNSWRELWC